MPRVLVLTLGLALLLAACSSGLTAQPRPTDPPAPTEDWKATLAVCCPRSQPTAMSATSPATSAPTQAAATQTNPAPTPSLTPDARLKPERWQEWPVIPALSPKMKALYQEGLKQGNDPHAFSKIGDCQNITSHFLGFFDKPGLYALGDKYAALQGVLDQFKGSFGRESAAVRAGFNVAAVLSPLQADPAICKGGETPLQCEFRLHKPSIVFISMETWWAKKPADEYAKYMRQIIEFALKQKAVPILVTKADNLEGDHSVNAALAQLAYEYEIPLWNFWLAVQPLPFHGLNDDGFHLTNDLSTPDDPLLYRRLSDPLAAKVAWPVRNISALQVLEAVWKGCSP